MKDFETLGIRVKNGKLSVLDQQLLPHEEVWLEVSSSEDMIEMVKTLKIRGAPLIGVGAALALAVEVENGTPPNELEKKALALREARPTAVNLMFAIDQILAALKTDREAVVTRAIEILEEDVQLCNQIGKNGASLINDGESVLTHCNTGGLATAGRGTALGIIRTAHESGKKIHVYVDETRPLLQGGRLTTWELEKLGIPYTLICDNMAAILMRDGRIQRIFVGADRIALNGDFANKVGTYGVAALAKFHQIPFYPAAPYTTVDLNCQSGKEIPIEERDPTEVRGSRKDLWAPTESPCFNPAFDVTPVELITGLVLETGVISQKELIDRKLDQLVTRSPA